MINRSKEMINKASERQVSIIKTGAAGRPIILSNCHLIMNSGSVICLTNGMNYGCYRKQPGGNYRVSCCRKFVFVLFQSVRFGSSDNNSLSLL
jgi:hypothetical protein